MAATRGKGSLKRLLDDNNERSKENANADCGSLDLSAGEGGGH